MFQALQLNQQDGKTIAAIKTLDEAQLPDGDVVVGVDYSTLNYKDGLAITGRGKIIRDFPMVPGIDFAGKVLESQDARYAVGDAVILTGWGVGENRWGGLAEKAKVPGDWLVPMPTGFDAKKAMIVGTAGLTAMLCVNALLTHDIKPDDGEVLVTGASGGVGSIAVTLLAKLGYSVVASTGRVEKNGDWLRALGASEVIERDTLNQPAKPLERARWAGVIDTIGSTTLAKALAQTKPNGAAAICGLAGGMDLPTTVAPFILRGVNLLGIDSVHCPREARIAAWDKIAELLPTDYYDACAEITLAQTIETATQLVDGNITGRVVVALS